MIAPPRAKLPVSEAIQNQRLQHDKTKAWYHLAIWRKVKLAFLAKYPERAGICQWKDAHGVQCRRPATDTDHIIPHRGNWQLFLGGVDFSNLQGMCHQHHSIKTAQNDGGFGNQ